MPVTARHVGSAAVVAVLAVAAVTLVVGPGLPSSSAVADDGSGVAVVDPLRDAVRDSRGSAVRDARERAAPARIDNTQVVFDGHGRRLDAHDGDLLRAPDGDVYLYGTSYGCGFTLNRPGPYCGVRVYRTADLATWEPAGASGGTHAFDHEVGDWQELCTAPNFGCFRPHVVRRPSDGRFVMWINTHVGPGREAAGYRTLVADDPGGPFVDTAVAPRLAVDAGDGGLEHGDMDVGIDPATGIGYLAYTAIDLARSPTHTLVVEELDATLTTGTGRHVEVVAAGGGRPTEAPSLFRSPTGTWHIAYSDPAAPYGVVRTSVVDAPEPLGPWANARTLTPDSCSGQPAAVVDIGGTWVFMVDRWVQSSGGVVANQAGANTYWGRLTFDAAGGTALDAHACQPSWTLPRD